MHIVGAIACELNPVAGQRHNHYERWRRLRITRISGKIAASSSLPILALSSPVCVGAIALWKR